MRSRLALQLHKELRELFPWWLGSIAAILACGYIGRTAYASAELYTLQFLVLTAAALGLSAVAIGHEYTHGTLGALLAQPVSRRRLLATKFVVLIPLLAALTVVAQFAIPAGVFGSSETPWLVAALGFFLAPWLTMVGRGPLAGTVFAFALPAAISTLLVLTAHYWWWGRDTLVLLRFPNLVMPVVWATGGVLTWRRFSRLEALEGPGVGMRVPRWLRRPMPTEIVETRPRNAAWLMLRKELRLQQMTFVVFGLFVLVWAAIVVNAHVESEVPGPTLEALAIIHGGIIAVIIGALASAEERQLGMHDWQALQPIASWKAWVIKAGTAIGLTLMLAIGGPFLLSRVTEPIATDFRVGPIPVLLCIAALYVSSLSTSGLRALLAAFPVITGAVVFGNALIQGVFDAAFAWLWPTAQRLTPFDVSARYSRTFLQWTPVLTIGPLVIALAALILTFSARNHRNTDRSVRLVSSQLAWVAGYVVAATVIATFVNQLVAAGFHR